MSREQLLKAIRGAGKRSGEEVQHAGRHPRFGADGRQARDALRARRARRGLQLYASQRAKKVAATLIRDVGFDPMDVGPLKTARYTEPFSLVIAQLAYKGRGGYRFERFGTRA